MNVVKLNDEDCDDILEELKGKMFFAVSIENGHYMVHLPDGLQPSQIIYGCEVVKTILMNDIERIYDESEDRK